MKNNQRSESVAKRWNGVPATIYYMLGAAEAKEIDRLERPEILSYLPSFKDKTVLDLAAGTGRFTAEFAKEAKHVVTADISSTQIEENKILNASSPNIEYVCIDAMDMDFPAETFDLIFVSWLFMYLEDSEIDFLVPKLTSWLKPGGTLFFRESCAARRRLSTRPDYFAIYRGLSEYPAFFQKSLKLQKWGSVAAFEEVMSDPFRCYWIYQK